MRQKDALGTFLSTDLPEHLSSREKPYVGGHGQREAVSQPVELRGRGAGGDALDVY